MTELSVGALYGTVELQTTLFDRGVSRVMKALADLGTRAEAATASTEPLDESLTAVGASADKASAGLGRATQSTTRQTAAAEKAAASARSEAAAQARLTAIMADVAGASAKVQQATLRQAVAQDRMATTGSADFRRLAGAQASLIGAQERLAASQMTLGKRFGAMNAGALTLGRTLTSKVTMPILALGVAGGVMATRFDAQMTRIQTQAGASAASVKSLTASVLAMKNVQFGPQDLAASLYHLKSVGLDDAAAMKALRVSQDLAAVGGANLEDTTNALAGAWRTGIAGAKNFGQAAATVNSIIGAGNMTLTAFTTALGTGILPSAKTFGLTLKEVGAALALFTDEGVPADAAATRLRMTFSLLGAPTEKATKLLAGIGISQYQLGNDLRKPNGLIVAVSDLKDHLDATGMSATQQAALLSRAFGGGRSSSAILSMINNLDVLKKKQDQVNASTAKYAEDVRKQRQTPAAKFAIDLANLEKAGVLLGNEILPDLTELADDATAVVRGFNGLSSGARRFIIIAAGIAAVIGPVITIFSRLAFGAVFMGRSLIGAGRALSAFSVGASSQLTRLAGTSFTASARINTAMRGITAAIGGAAVGLAVGQMTKNASSGTKALGVLGSAAAGAAIGFGAGGPWGAAIGAGAGALASLSQAFDHTATAAISTTDAEQAFASSVRESTNAMAAANQAQTMSTLSNQKAFVVLDYLHKNNVALGVSYADLAGAVTGSRAKLDEVNAALRSGGPAGEYLIKTLSNVSDGFHNAIAVQKAYARAQAFTAISRFTSAIREGSDALPRFDGGIQSLKGSTSALSKTTGDLAHAEDAAWRSGKVLTNVLQELGGKQLTTAQAVIQFQQDVQGLKSAFDKNSSAILGNSKAALTNRSAILGALQAAKDHAAALDAQGKSAKVVQGALIGDIRQLQGAAVAAGGSKSAFKALIAQMHLTPKDIRTAVRTDTGNAMYQLRQLQAFLARLTNATYTIGVNENINVNAPNIHGHFAAGGTVHGPGTSKSDSVPIMASKGEEVIQEPYATRYRSILKAINVGRYANGGTVTTKQVGGKTVYMVGGHEYATRSAAQNAINSASASTAETRASGALTNIRLDSSSFSFTRFQQQIQSATALIADALKAGISHSQYVALQQRLHRDERRGEELERKLGRSIHGAANKLGGSLANLNNPASVGDVRGQLHTLEGLLRQAGLPKQFINGLDQENRHILALVKVRDQAARGLAKANSAMAAARAHEMNDYRSFAAASRGAFDITNPVASGKKITAGSLRAGQAQALTRVRQWVSGITKLAGKHIFPAAYLRQLAGGGPTAENLATVQALLSMSGAGLRSFASQERQIAQLSGQAGRVVAGRLDSHQLRVDDRRVQRAQERETRAQEHMVHALDEFGHRIVHALQNHHLEAKIKGGDLVVILRHGQRDAKAHHRTGRNLLGATP